MSTIGEMANLFARTLLWKRLRACIKGWTKIDIINELAAIHGYCRYLEICTPTTGKMHNDVDRSRFVACDRLMYRCHNTFDDGMEIPFRIVGLDIEDCVRSMREDGLSYDVILVDSFHEYGTSYRDLEEALTLIRPHGTIIVHDCLPPNERLAKPTFANGAWCGATYKAYLDFVMSEPSLEYCTIDTDYGCGVVRRAKRPEKSTDARHQRLERKVSAEPIEDKALSLEKSRALRKWKSVGNDYKAAFRTFQEHRRSLLNVVSVTDFLRSERSGLSLLTESRTDSGRSVDAERLHDAGLRPSGLCLAAGAGVDRT